MTLMSRIRRNPQKTAPQSLDRHVAFIESYLDSLPRPAAQDPVMRELSIIARSPASPVAVAVRASASRFAQKAIGVRAIFAELGTDGALADFCGATVGVGNATAARKSIRWARNVCLRDAHEQLILGTNMCWSGDCMRREPGKRNALDLYEREAPQVVRFGMLAFEAIWAICETVPASRLDPSASVKPSAAYAPDADWISAFTLLRRSDRFTPPPH